MITSPKENWFVAVLVFESGIRGENNDLQDEAFKPLVDLQFRLVRASDPTTAYERALVIGKRAEHAYENTYGETCSWAFKGLKDLQEVKGDEPGDGVEVYGLITDGTAENHVVAKDRLTGLLGRAPQDWHA
jgi:Domain of unknown function (DUF4288)